MQKKNDGLGTPRPPAHEILWQTRTKELCKQGGPGQVRSGQARSREGAGTDVGISTFYTQQRLTNEPKCEFHTTVFKAASLHDPSFAYVQHA